jgi:methionine-rich copper-binding protein CopC
MRKLASALSVTALVLLSLGLTTPSAFADPAHTVTIPCSDVFGSDAKGKITLMQNDDKVTLSAHCNTDLVGPEQAVKFECSIVDPNVKGQFVITPSGNFEGHCSVPL